MMDELYIKTPQVIFQKENMCFGYYRVCPKCGRFVKADSKCKIPEYQQNKPNATCKRCGRIQMPFADWYDET